MEPTKKQQLLKRYLEKIAPESSLESMAGDQDLMERIGAADGTDQEKEQAATGLDLLRQDEELSESQMDALEAIILPGERPVVDIIDDSFSTPERPFAHFGSGQIKQHIERAVPSIGRIELPDNPALPFGGTGFVVGPNLLMTNRHVAELFASGLGQKGLTFKSGESAAIDFKQENKPSPPQPFSVKKIRMIHPFWDMALLETDGLNPRNGPLSLSTEAPADLTNREVAVIGYPALDVRNNIELQNRIFRRAFNVKRLQPGKLGTRAKIQSFRKNVDAITHDSSTLGGNSGSAVVDVSNGKVVALHFAGLYLEANYAVPAFELSRDSRVVDEGVNFESSKVSGPTEWESYWLKADPPAGPESGAGQAPAQAPDLQAAPAATAKEAGVKVEGGAATWIIPLELTVRIGQIGAPGAALPVPAPEAEVEKLAEPFREESYDNRKGYDPNFLGIKLPAPKVKDLSVVARLEDGSHQIPYEHFSVVMHKKRRLALLTASNIDGSKDAKQPEPGRDYSRRGLSGLGKNDHEKWFLDPRIRGVHQLPDKFFTKDRGAFDKGHIVRRDDVAWGRTYEELRRANGDTYHVTNCSPQVAAFNRSNAGGDWGKLENLILKQAKAEQYCVFAGPILDDENDRIFRGKDLEGDVRVQIPSRFWKVVVARSGDQLQSFGFLLEQDLSDTDLEFAVSAEWRGKMIGIRDLEALVGELTFPDEVHESDQASTDSGESVLAESHYERFQA